MWLVLVLMSGSSQSSTVVAVASYTKEIVHEKGF